MNERLAPPTGEQLPRQETEHRTETHKLSGEQIASAEKKQQAVLHEMEMLSEELAHSTEDMQVQQLGENKPQSHSFGVHKELKLQNYKRLLSRAQSRLSKPEKSFSKTIHNKQVDRVSSVGAKTVARPVGILVGGLAAFIGSLVVLILARRYGFRYNFTLFILLFVGGYLLGTVLEAALKAVKRLRS